MINKINWQPTRKDLFNFGLVILIGFGVIGSLFFWKQKIQVAYWLWGGAGAVFLLSVIAPPAAKPFYMLWMGLGFAIGAVVSRIVMAIIFYLILTPVAIVFKLKKRDALHLKKKEGTYWQEHPVIEDKSYYKHLF